MNEAMIEEALAADFPGATIDVQLDGSHCQVTVISDVFEGLRPVARQQRVYAPLGSLFEAVLYTLSISSRKPLNRQR